jgi:pyruvate dehydrogenase kinase 2/3/4
VAKDVVERCGAAIQEVAQRAFGPDVAMPKINIDGHLDASFPYILSHIEYIIGELLRNSVQAVVEKHEQRRDKDTHPDRAPPPIEVTICESPQHVIIRVSDQGGGIPHDAMPYLWSFSKGPASSRILANLGQVPKMAATMQELQVEDKQDADMAQGEHQDSDPALTHGNSLASLSSRPPNLRLGMGLPLSRVYAEYWAGSLTLHSLEGYGVDAFLQISKLGNKNEQLTTRATMDAV